MEMRKRQDIEQFLADADICIVAGDLHVGRTNVLDMLGILAKKYKHVVYVLGNHELYHGLSLLDFNYHEFGIKLPNNVHFLNPGTVILEGITFIGTPLWTNFRGNGLAMKVAKSFISDFRRAEVAPQDYVNAYNFHLTYLKGMLERMPGKKVVVTHFMPAKELVDPKWIGKDEITGLLNYYFANDLGRYIETLEDTMWLFGHTHDSVDKVIGTTRCIANPLGYPGEKQCSPMILEM